MGLMYTHKSIKHRFVLGCLCLAVVLTLGLPQRSKAQLLYGSIVGNVKDPNGAAIAGATVTIVNRETNQSRETTTNDIGAFGFPTVATGRYEVKVNASGFKAFGKTDVVVSVNNATRVDITLEVGEVAETVLVTAEAAQLQTDRAEVRAEIPRKALQDLPVPPGRNYQHLFKTLPGFTLPGNAHSIPSNPSRALVFNVNGTSRSSNNVRVDGASQYNIWLPHVTAYVPALESIDTVNVVTNSFDIDQGLAGGAAINVQIRSGTNDLHGSVFEFHNDNSTRARPTFLPATSSLPNAVFNQFGGTIGGPIKKDKLFYFASYEGTTDRQMAFRFLTVPTLAMRRGDFSASDRPIYDPATGNSDGSGRTAFAGNIIPQSRWDPIAVKIMNLIPQPTDPNALTNNLFVTKPFSFTRHTVDGKVNWNVSSKFSMFGRLSILDYSMSNPEALGEIGGPFISSFGGNSGQGYGNTYSLTFAGTYTFTPNFIVDANFGWTRMDTNVEQSRLDEKLGLEFLGIPGTNGPRRFEGGWPRFIISGFATLGVNDAFMPYFRSDPQWQYTSNANWIKGRHNIRFGADIGIQHLNHQQPEFPGATHGGQGGFNFASGPTQVRGGPSGNSFNSFATFLLGLPTTIGKILQVPDFYTTRTSSYSFYFGDKWQATPKLTLSYGTRWEYFPIPTRGDRGMERYDLATNKMLVCGVGSVPRDCGVKISKNDFAPRFGLAYRVNDGFVLRAGYGITNDPYNLARPLRTNHPILLALNITAPNSFLPAGTLKAGIPPIAAPDLGNGIIDIPPQVAVNTLTEEFRRGYIQSWNVMLQKKLWWGFTAQAGYVATRQIRQLGFLDLNAGQVIGAGRNGQPFFQKFGRTTRTAIVAPVGGSTYDALQVTVERRFAHGYSVQLAYTWSKNIGIAGAPNSDNEPRVRIAQFYHLNRALSDLDKPNNLEITSIVELPFGPGKRWLSSGIGAAILGGWQLNGIFSAVSGDVLTVTSSGTSLNLPGSTQVADLVKSKVEIFGRTGRGESWFDPFAFAPVTEARFGTAGFNILRGPGYVNLDLGIFREFRLAERWRLQFRIESFNFTNTPHFSNPGTNRSSLLLNPDNTIRNLNGYTEVTSVKSVGREGLDERQFRFGLRLSF